MAEPSVLRGEELTVIREEELLLQNVREAILEANIKRGAKSSQLRMSTLRTDIEDADMDDVAAIAAEAQRVRATSSLQHSAAGSDIDVPYFAHMQLETDRGVRDVLLGQTSLIDNKRKVAIVDWRAAPVAEVFFQYTEGEDYAQDLPGRSVEGVLIKRRILAFHRGQLIHVQTPTMSLRREPNGNWSRDARHEPTKLEGGEGGGLAQRIIGTGRSGEKLPVVSSLLDAQQYEALTSDPTRPLLVLGGAGCGKTTVALHRLAHLAFQDAEKYAPENLIVFVPEEGLVRLTRTLLEELGMETVTVTTIDRWFAELAKRLFPNLPTRLAVSTPATVIRLKRHPALSGLLKGMADRAGSVTAAEIDRRLRADGAFEAHFSRATDDYPLARLEAALEATLLEHSSSEHELMREVFAQERAHFSNPEVDRERLQGDRVLLERVVEDANGELPKSVIDRLLSRFRIQDSPTAEEEFAEVEIGRRTTIDGLSLDAGTPTEDAGSIDVEDFALLIELYRLKTGASLAAKAKFEPYAHVVLDEAQELSQVELHVLGKAVAEEGSVTVAGDSAQQIGIGSHFVSWDHVLGALEQGGASPVTLATSYRCTRPIIEFAHAVLGPLAPDEAPISTKNGSPVSRSLLSSDMHAAILLSESLADLQTREATAQVAIITREDQTAIRLHETLRQQLPVRLVLDGEFSFKPGIDITSVPHVKGLEFDYVVIPDASRETYPTDPGSRRMLHVAATRAIHQLWVLATGSWSEVLPKVPR
ncbi:MAG: DNA helicase-2/ATP-dependent DNA helicase PcrA [Myxococcota bacterium]|jgi:DNA helicase-2/ATP-dependent DNA helicase PcrA